MKFCGSVFTSLPLHTTICVLILQYMCSHTNICVLIRRGAWNLWQCFHFFTTTPTCRTQVYLTVCMCLHSSMVFSLVCHDANVPHAGVYVSSFYYMCLHTYYICVLIAVFGLVYHDSCRSACRDWQVQLPLGVLILLYICPRTSIYVSWYYANLPLAARAVTEKYKCRPAGPDECFCGYFGFSGDSSMRTHILLLFPITACVSAYCFTTMCPHTTILMLLYIFAAALASHNTICVLILYMCHRTTIYYICVLVLLNVSSYYYIAICVLMLLYISGHVCNAKLGNVHAQAQP